MASMRNGSGDGYFLLFNPHGAIVKGYAHESSAARWCADHGQPLPGMFDGVPPEFKEFLTEPAFSINETTFCCWRRNEDRAWSHGIPDYPGDSDGGASGLLSILSGDPDVYLRWASEYFEQPVEANAVYHIYSHNPLSKELLSSLNPRLSLEQLMDEIEEIGYGVQDNGYPH